MGFALELESGNKNLVPVLVYRLQAGRPGRETLDHAFQFSAIAVLKETYCNRSELVGLGLAILLSDSAGAVDIIAYLQFDHVFVANMTGNTVLFASCASPPDWSSFTGVAKENP